MPVTKDDASRRRCLKDASGSMPVASASTFKLARALSLTATSPFRRRSYNRHGTNPTAFLISSLSSRVSLIRTSDDSMRYYDGLLFIHCLKNCFDRFYSRFSIEQEKKRFRNRERVRERERERERDLLDYSN
jgi:hypothetical protein